MFSPISGAHGLSAKGNHSHSDSVAGLFLGRSPATVTRFIIAVVVRIAVERMFGGRLGTHVGHETQQGMNPIFPKAPPVTNRDAATAVALQWFGSVTSGNHLDPRSPYGTFLGFFGLSVLGHYFSKVAPTRGCFSLRNATAEYDFILPAIAPPKPLSLAGFAVATSKTDSNQLAKSLMEQISNFWSIFTVHRTNLLNCYSLGVVPLGASNAAAVLL